MTLTCDMQYLNFEWSKGEIWLKLFDHYIRYCGALLYRTPIKSYLELKGVTFSRTQPTTLRATPIATSTTSNTATAIVVRPTTTMTTTTSFPSTTIPSIIISVDELITKSSNPDPQKTTANSFSMATSEILPDDVSPLTPKFSGPPSDSPIDRGTTSSTSTSTTIQATIKTTRKTTTTEKVIQMTIYSNTQSTISRRSGAPPTEVTTWSFTKSTRFTPNQPSDHSGRTYTNSCL